LEETQKMGCCGQKRDEIKSTSSPMKMEASPQAVPLRSQFQNSNHQQNGNATKSYYHSVTLRYLEISPILVRGQTGRPYTFSGANPNQSVDPRDAEALLRTRFFRQVS
jgi:hypothetical protein